MTDIIFLLFCLFIYFVNLEIPDLQSAGRKDLTKYGIPDRGPNIRFYTNHALSYDQAKKIPLWVAEHITKSDSQGRYT